MSICDHETGFTSGAQWKFNSHTERWGMLHLKPPLSLIFLVVTFFFSFLGSGACSSQVYFIRVFYLHCPWGPLSVGGWESSLLCGCYSEAHLKFIHCTMATKKKAGGFKFIIQIWRLGSFLTDILMFSGAIIHTVYKSSIMSVRVTVYSKQNHIWHVHTPKQISCDASF